MRECFPFFLDGIKIQNKVMSGYVDDCILYVIQNSVFKHAIPLLIAEIKDNKAKLVRERCFEYLNEILIHWDLSEREAEVLVDVVRLGLEDAAVKGREISRILYLNLFARYPKKTEKIKLMVTKSLQLKLIEAECDYVREHGRSPELIAMKTSLSPTSKGSPPASFSAFWSSSSASSSSPSHANRLTPSTCNQLIHSQSQTTSSAGKAKQQLSQSTSSLHIPRSNAGSSNIRAITPTVLMRPHLNQSNVRTLSAQKSVSEDSHDTASYQSHPPARRILRSGGVEHLRSHSHSHINLNRLKPAASEAPPLPPTHRQLAHTTSPAPTTAVVNISNNIKRSASKEEAAILSIQATIRGTLTRRRSVIRNPFEQITSSAPSKDESFHSECDSSSASTSLVVNTPVLVHRGASGKMSGVIRFVGETLFAPDLWVGVELDGPWGKNDGSVQGVVYFRCCRNCGIFVRTEHIESLPVSGMGRQHLKTASCDSFLSKSEEQRERCREEMEETFHNSVSEEREKENLRPLLGNNSSSSSDSNGHQRERSHEFTSLWKAKLADMMELVSKQWDMVKELEDINNSPNSIDVDSWKDKMALLCSQEMEVASHYQKKLANI